MIFSFLKKHRTFFAAVFVLGGTIAAPYLVPTDPDSAVFRSGTFGALLLLAAAFPVRQALEKHTPRALVYGWIFSWILLLCMGVGCELSFYDGLLPGMGSMIRRFAVPCLATPLFGCLISYVFAYTPSSVKKPLRIPYIAYFLLIAASYIVILLILFPGVISYDFAHEMTMYTTGKYYAAHPVFHTMLLGSLYQLGETIWGSMTAGAATYSVVQLLLLAAMYAYACVFVQRRVHQPLAVIALAVCFAFLPFHGTLAVSTAKDPLFAGLCVLLSVFLWELAEDPDAFLSSRFRIIRFCICCLMMALLRHNSVFATIPACLSVPLFCKNKRLRAIAFSCIGLAICLLIPRTLEAAVDAEKTLSTELMSIPCQQLFRTAQYADLSEEEFEEISEWFSHATHRYRPHFADPAKGGNFDASRFNKHPEDFWEMYFRYGKAYPRIYLEAFLSTCMGIWYPGDTSHAHNLSSEEEDFIYLNTVYPFEEGQYDIEPKCLLPALWQPLYRSMHHADHERYAFYSALFCPATYSFLTLLGTMLLFFKKDKKRALCLLPMWGIFISILFSTGVLVRYAYPMMAAVPVLFCLILFTPKKS